MLKTLLKKSLNLLLTALFLSNTKSCLTIQNVMAYPPVSPLKYSEDDEFEGDDGKLYILGTLLGRGNQSLVYRCIGKENNHNYVVKIPLFSTENECDRNEILKLLKSPRPRDVPIHSDSSHTKHDDSSGLSSSPPKSSVTSLVPPPRPEKPHNPQQYGDKNLRRPPINFDLDNLTEGEVHNIEDLTDESVYTEEEQLFIRPKKMRPTTTEGSKITVDDTHKAKPTVAEVIPESDCQHPKTPTATFKQIPKPDRISIQRVIDPSITSTLRSNTSPYIISITSFVPYIESLQKQTLMELLKSRDELPKNPTDFNRWALCIISCITQALLHLHKLNICHRDIKSDNILVDESGKVTVGDLGAACFFSHITAKSIGTPGYMAPELHSKISVVDPAKVDIFALGITALEILAQFNATPDFGTILATIPKSVRAYLSELPLEKILSAIPEDIPANILVTHSGDIPTIIKNDTVLGCYCEKRNRNIKNHISEYRMRIGSEPIPNILQRFLAYCLDPEPAKRASAEELTILLNPIIKASP